MFFKFKFIFYANDILFVIVFQHILSHKPSGLLYSYIQGTALYDTDLLTLRDECYINDKVLGSLFFLSFGCGAQRRGSGFVITTILI